MTKINTTKVTPQNGFIAKKPTRSAQPKKLIPARPLKPIGRADKTLSETNASPRILNCEVRLQRIQVPLTTSEECVRKESCRNNGARLLAQWLKNKESHGKQSNLPPPTTKVKRKCVVLLKRIKLPIRQNTVETIRNLENSTPVFTVTTATETTNTSGRTEDPLKNKTSTPTTLHECVVRLKRIPEFLVTRATETTTTSGRTEDPLKDKINTPTTLRGCVVRLKRTPFQAEQSNKENNVIASTKRKLFAQKATEPVEIIRNLEDNTPGYTVTSSTETTTTFGRTEDPLNDKTNTPTTLPECVVRLKRTPFQAEKSNKGKATEPEETFRNLENNTNEEPVQDVEPFETQRNDTININLEDNVTTLHENVEATAKDSQQCSDGVSVAHPIRFFHRELKTIAQPQTTFRNRTSAPKQRSPPKNVFDFLSESNNNIEAGPVDDVIKRLIEQGKVVVATNYKGKGRPKIKRKVISKKKASRKGVKREPMKSKPTLQPQPDIEMPQMIDQVNAPIQSDISVPTMQTPSFLWHKRHNTNNSPDSTFSRLARSVLLQQTRQTHSIDHQNKLLDAARKFVSTPLKPQSGQASPSAVNISPIAVANSSRQLESSNRSPWRVDPDAHLPVAFNFSTNSSNLPSFSSDVILSHDEESPQMPLHNWTERTPAVATSDAITPIPVQSTSKSLNSYSSNDSNAENMPPTESHPAYGASTLNENEANANIFNLRQFPNPRRALQQRSPLKVINILEVVTLPTIDVSEITGKRKRDNNMPAAISNTNDSINTSNFYEVDNSHATTIDEDDIVNEITPLPLDDSLNKSPQKTNLFGFEEFLEDETQTGTNLCQQQDKSANRSLREKLNKLKKFRPNDDELPRSVSTPLRPIFDDMERQGKQRDLKEMLCSTMINASTRNRLPVDAFQKEPSTNGVDEQQTFDGDSLHLFEEPELTFKDKGPNRTYSRPFKKKRKIRHNFVMFMDSDESNSEEEGDASFEEIEGNEKGRHKRKIQHKEAPKEAELNTFINEFNDMCKDIEKYVLVVE